MMNESSTNILFQGGIMLSSVELFEHAKDSAVRLREAYLEKYGDPNNPLHLDLVKLCSKIGGEIELVKNTSRYEDFTELEAREDGYFLVRLRVADHLSVPYESSFRLAFIIGDWLLNFQSAEPGTACRTYRETVANNTASYTAAKIFGWNLLLPADLFESVWWMTECDLRKTVEAFNLSTSAIMQRAQQLSIPLSKPKTTLDEGGY
jgi:hypothetical protein